MPKSPGGTFLDAINLNRNATTQLYRQIYDTLRNLIVSGELASGTRLPSTRVLMKELKVSRTTVRHAFEQLTAEGYLSSLSGSGTYVALQINDALLQQTATKVLSGAEKPLSATSLSKRGFKIAGTNVVSGYSHARPFVHSVPGWDQFPLKTWTRLLARQWHRIDDGKMGYGELAGYQPLRKVIASYLTITRGISCHWEQVIIVAGAQQAFGLVATMLLDPGDSVWVEEPGYGGSRDAFVAAGLNLIPVPVDQYGLNVKAGCALKANARLAYITPSHQFPLGMIMSFSRRLEILEWARQKDAWVIEDDYDSEFRYIGQPLPAMQVLDQHERTIYIGTFSKILFPSLRLGYLVVPPSLSGAFTSANGVILKGLPTHLQAAVTDFITEGHFAQHIRRMRKIYKERLDALLEAAHSKLNGLLDVSPSNAGLHLIGWLPEGIDDVAMAKSAAARGIDIVPLSSYYQHPAKRGGFVLGFASVTPQMLRMGIDVLASVLRDGVDS